MKPLAVSCRNITKSFPSGGEMIPVIRGVNLEVMSGEFLMLVGPSGCGKTTLISMLAGILSYDGGECEVLSENYRMMSKREILDFRARNIGFIFQQFHLLPSLNVLENTIIPLIINKVNRAEAQEKGIAILKEVGLGDKIFMMPNQLSGGQQQRVAIARALVHAPKLLVCDEPTSALDHDTGMKIMEVMKHMQQKLGTTLLVVSHDNRIYHYASRIAHMDDGVITHIETQNTIESKPSYQG
jgi:putative ABC transport system ATP-binding protein